MSVAPSKDQVRGARGMLDWSLWDLARAAQVSVSSVKRFEVTELDSVSRETADKIRDALEHQGITFLIDDGTGLGLRLRAPANAAE
jgi:predicted transcriptional regulator